MERVGKRWGGRWKGEEARGSGLDEDIEEEEEKGKGGRNIRFSTQESRSPSSRLQAATTHLPPNMTSNVAETIESLVSGIGSSKELDPCNIKRFVFFCSFAFNTLEHRAARNVHIFRPMVVRT